MIDGATAVDDKPSATVNSESYFEQSRDMRKTKMAIMETNIGREPICHGHEIVNKNKTVSLNDILLNVPLINNFC